MLHPHFLASAAPPSGAEIPLWLGGPFALLLLLIAVMPLAGAGTRHWWEKSYPAVSVGLGALVAGFYLVNIPGGGGTVAHALGEYFSFIALLGALFVVAGGIHLRVRGGATPLGNVAFLAVGAVLANVVGTTGASVVLIRPWLRMNQGRVGPYHVVFFIFVVANLGGALTPIGDPPLLLGHLRGVPFFWLVGHVWAQWLATLAAVLAVFWALDVRGFARVAARRDDDAAEPPDAPGARGLDGGVNVALLLAVVGAVFLPGKFFLREAAMLGAAAASWRLTPAAVRAANAFTLAPLREVAWLFAGIFLTMMPALGWLAAHGRELGLAGPLQFYLVTGGLSAVLDNAPTYLSLLQVAQAAGGAPGASPLTVAELLAAQPQVMVGLSLGAVFFGAMTYIGNGPNLMVRAIAQDAGARCPTFFGYVFKYSLPILLPILALTGWLFLR